MSATVYKNGEAVRKYQIDSYTSEYDDGYEYVSFYKDGKKVGGVIAGHFIDEDYYNIWGYSIDHE